MKWKDLIKKVNTKKYAVITDIKEDTIVKSEFKNFYKNHKILFYICIIAIIVFVIFSYKTSILRILLVLALLAAVFTFVILKYMYTLEVSKNGINVKLFQEEISIPIENLVNIFIFKEKADFLFFIKTYKIGIIFNNSKINEENQKDENKGIREKFENGLDKITGTTSQSKELENAEQILLTLSTAMVNKKDILNLFNNLQISIIEKQQADEDKELEENNNTKKAVIITTLICLAVALIVGFILFLIYHIK